MKVLGLDGRFHSLSLAQYRNNSSITNKSQYHLKARELIRELYPNHPAYEEVMLPGSRLYVDFLLPTNSMMIEVHGEQHYSDNSFFYKTYADFIAAKQRDARKKEWCELNNYTYVELPYKESNDDWKKRLC